MKKNIDCVNNWVVNGVREDSVQLHATHVLFSPTNVLRYTFTILFGASSPAANYDAFVPLPLRHPTCFFSAF